MFELSVTLLILLVMGNHTHPENTRNLDYDSAWDELFGHLTSASVSSLSKNQERDELHTQLPLLGKQSQSKSEKPIMPAIPPSPPFIFDPESGSGNGKFPSVGAHSYGNMEGIAISQNRGIALGIYMVNSSYNNFNTVFGTSNVTKSYLVRVRLPRPNKL